MSLESTKDWLAYQSVAPVFLQSLLDVMTVEQVGRMYWLIRRAKCGKQKHSSLCGRLRHSELCGKTKHLERCGKAQSDELCGRLRHSSLCGKAQEINHD